MEKITNGVMTWSIPVPNPRVDPIKLFFFFLFFLRSEARSFYFLLIFVICNKHASLPAKTEKFFVSEEKKLYRIGYWFIQQTNERHSMHFITAQAGCPKNCVTPKWPNK